MLLKIASHTRWWTGRRRITPPVVAITTVALLHTASPGSAEAREDEERGAVAVDLNLAVALVADLPMCSRPVRRGVCTAGTMNVLSPHIIMEEHCDRDDGEPCELEDIWYRVRSMGGEDGGWVEAPTVARLMGRHALLPRVVGSGETVLSGYCSEEAIERAVAGERTACMGLTLATLDADAQRAPYPVLMMREFTSSAGTTHQAYQILAPTLYSNIIPRPPSARKKKGLDVDRCSSGPATAGGSVQVGLFCGEAVDAEIATRVRPYAEDDACVVRPLWVLEDRLLDDVALLSREEALGTADALTAIAVLMREDGEGCAHVDEPVWYVPLDRLLPLEFQPDPTGGSAFLGYPPMGQDLLDFWRVRVKKGSTVLPYSVYDMKNLVPERCLHLQSQVRDARKSIEIRVDLVPDAFQWFPVSWLP